MLLRIKIVFFLLCVLNITAQYFPSKNYTTTDGLPNNAVRALFLDKNNVLWIGTENGVSRKENGAFYNIDESDGLGHNSCWDITQDQDGNMWFAHYGGGVSKFNGKKFTVFTTKNGLPINRVRKLLDYKNEIFVGTEFGVSIINVRTHKVITPKGIQPHFGVFLVSNFFIYKDEVYFSTINEGLFKIDRSTGTPKIIPFLKYQNVYALGFFGTTFYGSNKGFVDEINFIGSSNKDFLTSTYGKSIVWQYAKDKNNNLYAAAWGVFAPDGGLYTISNKEMLDVSKYFGIDSKNLLNVVYDKSKDILFVGSKDKGIYEVRLDKTIDYNRFDDKAIIDFEVFFGKRVILNQDGVTLLNPENKFLTKISLLDFKKKEADFVQKNIERLPKHEDGFYELNYAIPANKIEFYEIVKHNKSLWISSNIGIFEIHSTGKIAGYIPLHTYKFGFAKDNKFIETIPYAGVHVYNDVYSLQYKHYSEFKKNTPLDIVKILNNKDKTYLLSVFNGIYTYQNNQFKSYLVDRIWNEKKFKHIAINDKGQLILAAEFGNVFVVEDNKRFKIVNTIKKEQFIGNTILFLEAYKDYIFIGTERGITIYQNGKFRLFDQEQGFKDANVTTSAIFDDQLWLGTKKGYYTLDLNKILKNQITVSSLAVGTVTINGVAIDKSNYINFEYASKELVCDYKHNSFLIDFIPKGNPFSNKLQFRYRLQKTERWSPYNTKTNLYLSYLPSGKYAVEVQIYDANAGKTTLFHLLNIQIMPPFWLRWWFIAMVLLLALLAGSTLFLRYKKQVKDRALIQKRIEQTKLEALLSQMNPHFTFNAMNAIQDFIIKKDVDNSLQYIGNFAKLMRKTLENSSKPTITIEEELEYLKLYIAIENMRFDNRIKVEFCIAPDLDIYFCRVPTMLLQPFVENVFVHAFDDSFLESKLCISLEIVGEKILECKISDNGKGFAITTTQKVHQSKAIHLAKERLALLQDKVDNPIRIEEAKGRGTTVTIHLQI